MALPTILVNSATGSDTAASGAGPTTALTGTSASFSGGTVTLDGSPDLSGVATDGSHVLYMVTSSGVRFFKITGADNGADTVTVTPNPAGTSTGRTWAIGGKRASIGSASSRLLFDNGSAAGDAMPGWAIEMESGHAETISAVIFFRRSGDTTSGPIILRGTSGAATMPILTASNNGDALSGVGATAIWLQDFEMQNTNATKTASQAITDFSNGIMWRIEGMKIAHSTNKFWKGISGVFLGLSVRNCEIGYTASVGIELQGYALGVHANYIHDTGSYGINLIGGAGISCNVAWNTIYQATTAGIRFATTSESNARGNWIVGNTIDSTQSTGSGILVTPDDNLLRNMVIANNLLTNNTAYGLNFSHANHTANYLHAKGVVVTHNNTYNNTSGAYNPASYGSDDPGLDPDYVDAGAGDFTPQTAGLEGTAYPVTIP